MYGGPLYTALMHGTLLHGSPARPNSEAAECNTHALSLIPPVLLQVRILALFENQKRIFLAMCVIDTISFVLFILVITLTGGQYSFDLCV